MPQPGIELPEERAVMFEARRQRKVPPLAGRWVNGAVKNFPRGGQSLAHRAELQSTLML